jgi:hypothetical protein
VTTTFLSADRVCSTAAGAEEIPDWSLCSVPAEGGHVGARVAVGQLGYMDRIGIGQIVFLQRQGHNENTGCRISPGTVLRGHISETLGTTGTAQVPKVAFALPLLLFIYMHLTNVEQRTQQRKKAFFRILTRP